VAGRDGCWNGKLRRTSCFSTLETKFVVRTEFMSGAVRPLVPWVSISAHLVLLCTSDFLFKLSNQIRVHVKTMN